jgi:hypothetical protein
LPLDPKFRNLDWIGSSGTGAPMDIADFGSGGVGEGNYQTPPVFNSSALLPRHLRNMAAYLVPS